MKQFTHVVRQPAALTLALLLAACGGGGGGGGDSTPPPPVPTPVCNITIVADASVALGKTAGAAALSACTAPISTLTWTQVSGPEIDTPTKRSTTVAIRAKTAGVVRMRADATLSDGRTSSATTDITVTAPVATSYVTVRADHSVRVSTDTSVRAWPVLANGETVSKIVWTQLGVTNEKDRLTVNTSDQNVLTFRTPAEAAVTVDTALRFRATMTTSSGTVDSDDVIVNIERQAATPNNFIFRNSARVHPYVTTSAYAGTLARCAYDVGLYFNSSTSNTLCPASSLPLLQADAGTGTPTVAQIMARVLVSHDFLGANFERFLTNQDPHGDFRKMLASVNAIVIGSHVRPSFYHPATASIYLDANYLWLTADERDVVTEVPDYRLAFDDALNFTSLGRQVKDNAYARRSYPETVRETRPESDLVFGLGRLLYHELAHANDYFAPNARTVNPALSLYANLAPREASKLLPSDELKTAYPLKSAQMMELGQIMFLGAVPKDYHKAYTAAQVGSFFESDVASDEYAYSISGEASSREDLAMLFEEFMMGYRYGIQYDVAYSNVFTDGMTADQLIVAWGQRGRIGTPAIKPRVKLVVSRVAPWVDLAAVDALPAPIQMRVGQSWDANLQLSGAPQPARFFTTLAQKRDQAHEDVAGRRHAH